VAARDDLTSGLVDRTFQAVHFRFVAQNLGNQRRRSRLQHLDGKSLKVWFALMELR
jgi:hypothetical protein